MAGLLTPQRQTAGNGLLDQAPRRVDDRVAGLLGLDPSIQRGAILPFGRDASGEMVMAWPEMALDTLKSLMLPGHVVQGGEFTPRDVTEMALDVGMLSSVAPAPAGAKRMFGGISAKNAPLDDLAKAEAMEKAGEAADDIWRATGWGRGADQKWRFEIDDSGAKSVDIYGDPARTDRVIGASVNAKRDAGQLPQATSLDDVLTHTGLSKQYGDVPEGGVFFDDLAGARGRYQGDLDTMTLDDGMVALDPAQAKNVHQQRCQRTPDPHAVQRWMSARWRLNLSRETDLQRIRRRRPTAASQAKSKPATCSPAWTWTQPPAAQRRRGRPKTCRVTSRSCAGCWATAGRR
jgi:hypothetical protein